MLAFIDFVNIASPLVGKGPNVKTCIPPDVNPDTKAGSKVYPDNLVSLAIIAICFDFFSNDKYTYVYPSREDELPTQAGIRLPEPIESGIR